MKISWCIQKLLWRHTPKTVSYTHLDVYKRQVPCSYGQLYIGTTNCSFRARVDEHSRYYHLRQPEEVCRAFTRQCRPSHSLWRDETSVIGECEFSSPAYEVRLDSETCHNCNKSAGWNPLIKYSLDASRGEPITICLLLIGWWCQTTSSCWLEKFTKIGYPTHSRCV